MIIDTHIIELIDLLYCIHFMIFQNLFFLFQVLVSSCSGNVNLEHGENSVTETQCKNDLLLGYT